MDTQYSQTSNVRNLIEPATLSMNDNIQILPELKFPLQDSNNCNTKSKANVTSSKTKHRKINGGTPRGTRTIFLLYILLNYVSCVAFSDHNCKKRLFVI